MEKLRKRIKKLDFLLKVKTNYFRVQQALVKFLGEEKINFELELENFKAQYFNSVEKVNNIRQQGHSFNYILEDGADFYKEKWVSCFKKLDLAKKKWSEALKKLESMKKEIKRIENLKAKYQEVVYTQLSKQDDQNAESFYNAKRVLEDEL